MAEFTPEQVTRQNKKSPMSILYNHTNPFVKFQERNRRRIIQKHIRKYARNKNFCDVGCEHAYFTTYARNYTDKVTGIDIDPELIRQNQEKHKNITFKQSSILNINAKDEEYETVLCACCLEHIKDANKAMTELVRITKPGGILIINVPNEKVVLTLKKIATTLHLAPKDLAKGQAHAHLQTYTKKLLKEHIMDEGQTKTISIKYDPPYYTNIIAILKKDE